MGLNQHKGELSDPHMEGIFDNYSVKHQIINSGPVITCQLLLEDKILGEGPSCERNIRNSE